MLEMRANIFNLIMNHMRTNLQIKHDRLVINRAANYDQVVKPHNRLGEPAPTGEAIITVPEEITDSKQAIKYAQDYLVPYQRLLSLAQGHDVYFWAFRCFEIKEDGTRKEINGIYSSMREGNHSGATIVYDLNEFLSIAAPLLNDKKYTEETGLDHALMIYNEANNYPLTIEVKVALFFIGLETLANAYWSQLSPNSKRWLFDKAVWSKLWQHLTSKFGELSIKEPELSRLSSSFGNMQDPPIEEKIKMLCQSQSLPPYSKEIHAMALMRNALMHGRATQREYNGIAITEILFMSGQLLAKLLLKLLNYYRDWPKVHGSITSTDLSARS